VTTTTSTSTTATTATTVTTTTTTTIAKIPSEIDQISFQTMAVAHKMFASIVSILLNFYT
jgi:hypothetical protein